MDINQFDFVGALIAIILAVVWLVRLEGRVNGKADASAVAKANENIALADQKVAALEASAKVHESTKEEVIRLQEQIKHLTSLFEGWMRDQAPSRTPRKPAGS